MTDKAVKIALLAGDASARLSSSLATCNMRPMLCSFSRLDGALRPVLLARLLPAGQSIECLVDTGSPNTCLPKSLADRNGVLLSEEPDAEFSLVGVTRGWSATVNIWLSDAASSQSVEPFEAKVYFCDPWVRQIRRVGVNGQPETVEEPRTFGILGLDDCLDNFKLTVWAHINLFQLEREGFDRWP